MSSTNELPFGSLSTRRLRVEEGIYRFDWSPDGTKFGVLKGNQQFSVWKFPDWQHLYEFKYGGLFSPDGRWIVSSSDLIDSATGELRTTLYQAYGEVAWSPDGRTLAVAKDISYPKDIRIDLLEPETGNVRGTLRQHKERIEHLSWSPDGRWLVSASGDDASGGHTLVLWEMEHRGIVAELNRPRSSIDSIKWSPDSEMLLVVYSKNNVGRVLRPATGELVGNELQVTGKMEWEPGSQFLLGVDCSGVAHKWSPTGGDQVLPRIPTLSSFSFSSDGSLLASGAHYMEPGAIRIRRTDTWATAAVYSSEMTHPQPPEVRFHPSLPIVAAAAHDEELLYFWELDAESLRDAPAVPEPTQFDVYMRQMEAAGQKPSAWEIESIRQAFGAAENLKQAPSPSDLTYLHQPMEMMGGRFDVFLCHNSAEKASVREIAKQLTARGIRVWLDEWELRPGLDWQTALEHAIENIHAAAVLVGDSGIGPWQNRELKAFINEFVRRGCPVIPVILGNCSDVPRLPLFLAGMTWVDFRKQVPDPLEELTWGITGKRPNRT